MKKHSNALAAKVAAVNLANAEANRLSPILTEFFRPYLGAKILKTDNTLLESIKKNLPEFPTWQKTERELESYLTAGAGYSLRLNIRATQAYTNYRGDYAEQSAEASVYICEIQNQIMGKLYPAHERRDNYSAEEIAELREQLEKAERVVSSLKSKLVEFGSYEQGA